LSDLIRPARRGGLCGNGRSARVRGDRSIPVNCGFANTEATMDTAVARTIAHYSHIGQRTRHGTLLGEHVERVAAAVPPEARSVAFLHDVLEKTETGIDELREQGLTPVERASLALLTRGTDESFELHTLRIAQADGEAGRIARTVKLADLEDHLGRARDHADGPPYGWALQHILASRSRYGEAPADPRVSSPPTA
jgi:hypothetical protein